MSDIQKEAAAFQQFMLALACIVLAAVGAFVWFLILSFF